MSCLFPDNKTNINSLTIQYTWFINNQWRGRNRGERRAEFHKDGSLETPKPLRLRWGLTFMPSTLDPTRLVRWGKRTGVTVHSGKSPTSLCPKDSEKRENSHCLGGGVSATVDRTLVLLSVRIKLLLVTSSSRSFSFLWSRRHCGTSVT